MSMNKKPKKVYKDGRTKQSFKDETDINKILQRAEVKGSISHLNKYEAKYGDFADYDFFNNTLMLTKGREIFDDLPAELRLEFRQSPAEFFKYVNDPANSDRLKTLLPGLAAPGRQYVAVNNNQGADAPSEPEASETNTPEPPPQAPETPPEAGSGTP